MRLRGYTPRGLETHESGPYPVPILSHASIQLYYLRKTPYFPPQTLRISPSQLQDFILDLFLQGDPSEFTWSDIITFLELFPPLTSCSHSIIITPFGVNLFLCHRHLLVHIHSLLHCPARCSLAVYSINRHFLCSTLGEFFLFFYIFFLLSIYY